MAILEPISEQFRIIAKDWVSADEAASLMEESKGAVLSEMINEVIGSNISLPFNKAELAAKGSSQYRDYITEMVKLRSKANLLKVKMRYIEMRFSEEQSMQATARSERRL